MLVLKSNPFSFQSLVIPYACVILLLLLLFGLTVIYIFIVAYEYILFSMYLVFEKRNECIFESVNQDGVCQKRGGEDIESSCMAEILAALP